MDVLGSRRWLITTQTPCNTLVESNPSFSIFQSPVSRRSASLKAVSMSSASITRAAVANGALSPWCTWKISNFREAASSKWWIVMKWRKVTEINSSKWLPSWEQTYPSQRHYWVDDFAFPLGYVSSLECTFCCFIASGSSKNYVNPLRERHSDGRFAEVNGDPLRLWGFLE